LFDQVLINVTEVRTSKSSATLSLSGLELGHQVVMGRLFIEAGLQFLGVGQ
jgi:hypothetical protein